MTEQAFTEDISNLSQRKRIGRTLGPWVLWAFSSLYGDPVIFEIANAVLTHKTAINDDDLRYTRMVNQFRAHHTGFTRNDKPCLVC